MYSDSRKAQRNSFAHHRAELLLSIERLFARDTVGRSATGQAEIESASGRAKSRRRQLSVGLLGFAPTSVAAFSAVL